MPNLTVKYNFLKELFKNSNYVVSMIICGQKNKFITILQLLNWLIDFEMKKNTTLFYREIKVWVKKHLRKSNNCFRLIYN